MIKNFLKKIRSAVSVFVFKIRNRDFNIECAKDVTLISVKANCATSSMGGGNALIINKKARLVDCKINVFGSNNKIVINEGCNLMHVDFWIEDNNNTIEIGSNTIITGKTQLSVCEGSKITIGKDCLFSHDIYVRTTDSHSIVDLDGNRINPAKDINIGNHVWIGMQSLILKGSDIGNNVIVAARSTVTRGTGNSDNVIVSGAPAKVIKESINWDRQRL